MKYVSTRTPGRTFDFSEVLMGSYAPDGGLYVPHKVPRFKKEELSKLEWLPFHELARYVIEPFLGGWIEQGQLSRMLEETFDCFKSNAVTPLYQTASNEWILELFHGPSGVYQDFGLQLMSRFINHDLLKFGKKTLMVGCTGGDTGVAAIKAFSGMKGVTVLVLHPAKGLTMEDRRRLLSKDEGNVVNIAVDGDYSDCHRLCEQFLKQNNDAQQYLISFNSVHWVRILAHLSFYFYSALQLGAPKREVAFSVPTGNFGALYAGYIAKQMGLPIRQLIVATNANAGLHYFLQSNLYSRNEIRTTRTPTMNVSLASNFERLQWSILNRCGEKVARNMQLLEGEGTIHLEQDEWLEARKLFDSLAVDDADAFSCIHEVFAQSGYLVSPNTAIGLRAARASRRSLLIPMICLATTHPSKIGLATHKSEIVGHLNTGGAPAVAEQDCTSIANDIRALTSLVKALSKDTESHSL
ncbi:threonine synthase [Pseudomonas brassicacearum]|uniref:threonine synthase n=1 Tax=Pseudomonas brassicacearum TaxID=930166 RepID=UPI00031E3712|nr:threonine synthase [Pseudomonas brassicacearum]ROM92939.1 threonine synthase [Pseudomonas brassicacearum]RON06996.1 threonine synthase [Pseudomonas brassicacearum]